MTKTNETKQRKTPVALCAIEIRKILKKEFPETKFSVRSSNFAGGNAVNVEYINGPTEDQIKEKIGHFQYGHFNGMEDIYEYSNNIEGLPQTKWLSINRELTEQVQRQIAERIKQEYGIDQPTEDLGKSFEWNGRWINWFQIVWQESRNIDLRGLK